MDTPSSIYYRKKPAPCKDCESRSVDCHPKCDRYKQWQSEKEAERVKAYQKYIEERDTTQYVITMCQKRKKRWHR